MKIAFRADASVQIGTGHAMRCLTLADELARQGHQCLFICRDHPGHLGELIAGKGFELHLLANSERAASPVAGGTDNLYAQWLGVPWQRDARQTLELLAPLAADWLVVDHYALDVRWEREVAAAVGQIMVIDDLADRDHKCALLLDQNLGRKVMDYEQRVPKDCIRLIGPHYALLRPEFARLRERSLQRRQHPELKRILISLGGVDRTNVTGQVLRALAQTTLAHETELDIIMGAAAPYLDDVREQAAQLPVRTTVSVNVTDMAERMCLADLSIGAAGSTSWERCCLGLPVVLVILADNQDSGARALEAGGAATAIGSTSEALQTTLPATLALLSESETLQRMINAAVKVTAGDGVGRVVAALTDVAGGMND
jgi:UDP-2,4-diacetamido-2,4,6-trideoxy-beta-L-altropyranose hydrolase